MNATKEQLARLRTYSQETGRTFDPGIDYLDAERLLARRQRRSKAYLRREQFAHQGSYESKPPRPL